MPELLPGQAEIINRGIAVDFPLEQICDVLDVPVRFSLSLRWNFGEVDLNSGELTELVPDAVVGDSYDYKKAVVVKLDRRPMLALCTGWDKSTHLDNNRRIATIFNLLSSADQELVTVAGRQLYNNDSPAGGLDLSDIVGKDLLNEVLEVTVAENGIALAVTQNVGV